MDFNYNKFLIKNFFNLNKKYLVPRYQREYSWGKNEIKAFLNDIINNIKIDANGKIHSTEYFFGNCLFVGNLSDSSKEVSIIDGQQRITTFTIFLSVLSRKFNEIGEKSAADIIWKYIMAVDDDGEEYAILVNDTPNPYFQYLIQTRQNDNDNTKLPRTKEEQTIKEAYDYFNTQLSNNKLVNQFKKIFNKEIEYLELLKVVRSQILESFIICIWTSSAKNANTLFETLNAKGLELTSIDLIKNCIFEKLTKTQPTDYASNMWKEIIDNLNISNNKITMSTFYRHYWISKYSKCTENHLYDEFLKVTALDNNFDYGAFLEDLVKNSKLYVDIIMPSIKNFDNRKDMVSIIESLKSINEVFKVTQSRVILMAVLSMYKQQLLTRKQLENFLNYLENFHFAYNGLCALRPNILESLYSKYAIALRKSDTKEKAYNLLEELERKLDNLFPKYDLFEQKFVNNLKFSKKNISSNVLTKYVVNKIENSFSHSTCNHNDGSIEHIISEDDNELTLNIGNLILLEEVINNKIPKSATFATKKSDFYERSTYKQIGEFCMAYDNFTLENITSRAKKLCDYYYVNILKRKKIVD